MPQYAEQESRTAQFDFSQGVIGKISETGLPVSARRFGRKPYIRMVRTADNAIFRPHRAVGVRNGFHDTSASQLVEPPHSLAKYYAPGANKIFVFTDSGGGLGKVWEDQTSAYVQYTTLPYTLTNRWVSYVNMNGALIMTQQGGSQLPFFWSALPANPAGTFLTCALPAPTQAITFAADTSGSGPAAGAPGYYYRVRWLYANGASVAGPVSAAHILTSPNLTANIKAPGAAGYVADSLLPASARTDWIGWSLERTWITGDPILGPWRTVWNGTATTYGVALTPFTTNVPDGIADSGLFYNVDDTQFGPPPHLEGIIEYRGRLWGWNGSSLYYSQPLVTAAPAGIFNFIGNSIIYVGGNDGDAIQGAVIQSGRLLIGKQRSIWTIEGDDPNSFRLSLRYGSAGFAGLRSATTAGVEAFFASGNGRLFRMHGNSVAPWGVDEVGEYLDTMDTSQDSTIVARNYNGEYLCFWHRQLPDTVNEDVLAYHIHDRTWTHWKSLPAADVLSQRDTSEVLLADPVLRQPVNVSQFASNPAFLAWTDSTATRALAINNADGSVKSAWTASGTIVGAATAAPSNDAICGDGQGNVFVLTIEPRSGISFGIYVQKFNASGAAQWTAGGVTIISGSDAVIRSNPAICADGASPGGCILVWLDGTALTPKSQRLDNTGAALWSAGGVVVSDGTTGVGSSFTTPTTVNLDSGTGCYITWPGNQSTDNRTFFQRLLLTNGARQFGNKGNPLSSQDAAAGAGVSACRDGAGNLLVSQFLKVIGFTPTGVVVYKINSSGTIVWTSANLDSTMSTKSAADQHVTPDGLGGCFVNWRMWSSGTIYDVYVNKVNSSGAAQQTTGIQVSGGATSGGATASRAVSDGAGGIVVAWEYQFNSLLYLIIAQRVNGSGVVQWAGGGASLASSGTASLASSGFFGISTDAAGGAIVRWLYNSGAFYVQRVSAAGVALWTPGGVVLEAAGTSRSFPSMVFTDTPQGEYVPAALPGYHVWSGLTGFTDQRAVDSSGGVPIQWGFSTHPIDDATPDSFKDFERIECDITTGNSPIVVNLSFDSSATPFSIQLRPTTGGATYDATPPFLYDTLGLFYAQDAPSVVFSGVPRGTLAKRYTFSVSASLTSALVFAGYAIHSLILPRRDFS